jgi:phage baseplate assembly protein W
MTSFASERQFLGRGWQFPLGIGAHGGIAMTSGDRDIEASILVILATSKGERAMRPEFGSSLQDFVFAPNNPTTHGLIAFHVQEALARWEPRIEVQDIEVEADPAEPSRVLIGINYEIRASNDERNLVFPFYLIPMEE